MKAVLGTAAVLAAVLCFGIHIGHRAQQRIICEGIKARVSETEPAVRSLDILYCSGSYRL